MTTMCLSLHLQLKLFHCPTNKQYVFHLIKLKGVSLQITFTRKLFSKLFCQSFQKRSSQSWWTVSNFGNKCQDKYVVMPIKTSKFNGCSKTNIMLPWACSKTLNEQFRYINSTKQYLIFCVSAIQGVPCAHFTLEALLFHQAF